MESHSIECKGYNRGDDTGRFQVGYGAITVSVLDSKTTVPVQLSIN